MRQSFLILFICSILSSVMTVTAATPSFSNESLNYKIMFKWGLIHKQAGHATLSLRNHGNNYDVQLVAASEKWADRIYQVRDTLKGVIAKNGFRPQVYEKIAYEDGGYTYDVVNYSYKGNAVTGNCVREQRKKKEKEITTNKLVLEATGTTVDMVSVFYYIRLLDYANMKAGDVTTINIFSGKRKEYLAITYFGIENVSYDKSSYDCYHIGFKFTSDGTTKTSDNIDTWITTDARHIPVKLEGQLPVGKIRCLWVE